jgi:hypothetical protein
MNILSNIKRYNVRSDAFIFLCTQRLALVHHPIFRRDLSYIPKRDSGMDDFSVRAFSPVKPGV